MSVLGNIRAHSQPDKVRSIEVPEWGEDGAPLVITYTMVTLGDLADAQAAAAVASGGSVLRMEAELVCIKSRTAAGEQMFRRIDVIELMEIGAPEVIRRVANEMMSRKSVDDIAKN